MKYFGHRNLILDSVVEIFAVRLSVNFLKKFGRLTAFLTGGRSVTVTESEHCTKLQSNGYG